MDFVKKEWQFRDIITEGELNRIEEGVEEGIAKAEAAQQAADEANQKADQNAADLIAHLKDTVYDGVHGLMATSSMTIYVDPINGDDNNSGEQQEPLKTIGEAVSRIKNVFIDGVILRIQLLPGTYQENVIVKNFSGSGVFELRGGDSLSEADNYVIDGHVEFVGCTCPAILRGIKVLGSQTVESAVTFSAGSIGRVENCKIDKSGRVNPINNYGIRAGLYSRAIVGNNDISNVTGGSGVNAAIQCFETGSMYLANNTGSNNDIGLRASGGIIFKAGAQQPNGVIEEETRNGGLITSGNAAAIVDMGSNTNGTYVRWGNGLQICWGMHQGVNTPQAGQWNYETVTFPASFYDDSYTVTLSYFGFPGLSHDHWQKCAAENRTTTGFRITEAVQQNATQASRYFWIAVGRWK